MNISTAQRNGAINGKKGNRIARMLNSPSPVPFGRHTIGPGQPVIVVAEIGINHEGNPQACEELIRVAADAGADAVKFQTINADKNYVPETESHKIFSTAWLSRDETERMFFISRELGVEPFTTAGDFETLLWIDQLAPAAHKISSGLLTHIPLITRAAATGRSLIMSTGMATGSDIETALKAASDAPSVLLQCTSIYPAPEDTLNLSVIGEMEREFCVPVGFSDHSLGIEAAAYAVAAGAQMIEKHLSLDCSKSGYDHPISLEPQDFKQMVKKIRKVEKLLGRPEKILDEVEQANAKKYHRCLVAACVIPAGSPLTKDNIAIKRPLEDNRGLEPSQYENILGAKVVQSLQENQPITYDCLAKVE